VTRVLILSRPDLLMEGERRGRLRDGGREGWREGGTAAYERGRELGVYVPAHGDTEATGEIQSGINPRT